MSYRKRGASPAVETAQNRITGIEQFAPKFDFGKEFTSVIYQSKIDKVKIGTQTYNGLLTSADAAASQLDIDEADLNDYNSRLLNYVGSQYGYDSIEYGQVGGVRTSDIKHSGGRKTTSSK